MSYIPITHTIKLTEDDVTELKTLLERLDQHEFWSRGHRSTPTARDEQILKESLVRILKQIPRI